MIKKADIILAAALLILGGLMSWYISFGESAGSDLEITVDGELFGTYPLAEDREITVEQDSHINKVTIKDGSVSMYFSDCKNQDCVHQHSISESGETIICLPNKVVLEIKGKDQKYDTVSR